MKYLLKDQPKPTLQRKTYRFKLEPNSAQEQSFWRFAGSCRFIYNQILADSQKEHQDGEKVPINRAAFCSRITSLKKEFDWLGETHVHCLQNAVENLVKAYQRLFKKQGGFPKFKSRHDLNQSFGYKTGVKVDVAKVWLPKIGWVKFRKSQDVLGKIKTAQVRRTITGWYVTLSCEVDIHPLAKVDRSVGVDVGLSSFLIESNGNKIESPKFFRKTERKLAKLQRQLSRKKKGSSNRAKAKRKVARLHEKVANQRKDFQHKQSTRLINENQVIGVEDLCVKGMARTRLAKSIHDAGLGEFLRQMKYKAEWYGRTLVEADRFFPSSKTCYQCGNVNGDLKLSDRRWKCPSCGTLLDRDVNTALNLESVAVGHTETLNACGGKGSGVANLVS